MSENNRQRVSIPIRGLDTSSTDINAPDGAMKELHNLRYSGEAWRNVKPFQVLERVGGSLLANKIFCYFDKEDTEFYIVSQFPVASDINITAYWWDVDGEYTSTTSATLKTGMSRVHIEETQESFAWIELNKKSDDKYIYYTDRDSVPEGIIDWEVVYQHPADDDDIFIARKGYTFYEDAVVDLYRVRIKDGEAVVLSVIAERLPSDVKVSHFGNLLILSSSGTVSYLYWDSEKYEKFEKPNPPILSQSTSLLNSNGLTDGYTDMFIFSEDKSTDHITLVDYDERRFTLPQFKEGCFWGEVCYFAIYQMSDGSRLIPSALCISASEPFYHGGGALKFSQQGYGDRYFSRPEFAVYKQTDGKMSLIIRQVYGTLGDTGCSPFGFAISPYVSVSIPDGVDQNLIKSVQIFSTRVNPIWDINKLLAEIELHPNIPAGPTVLDTDFVKFYADNKLPSQPFYLIKTIPIHNFANGVYSFRLNADILENIEQNIIYEAVDPHDYFFSESKEYNNRLHIFNFEQQLFKGYKEKDMGLDDIGIVGENIVRLKIGLADRYATTDTNANFANGIVSTKILSYPDYRGESIAYKEKGVTIANEIPLIAAEANNVSYAVNYSDMGNVSDFGLDIDKKIKYVKYPALFSSAVKHVSIDGLKSSAKITQNILRASAPSNPLVWPLANSYAIGTEENEIITVNSAAIEMSDSKFGEFPLYAFTKEGIFALQSGTGEVLYGSIVPLNYDRIINPNTLAVNYNIIYITDRGVHALYSNEATLISEKINDAANQPLLDFLKTAKFAYQHKYGEVILFNTDRDTAGLLKHPRAYTFSLGSKVWGTRDWNGGVVARELLNSGDMIEQIENSIILSDLNNEDRAASASFSLVSRPIKFNNQEFKRIETMVARLQASTAVYLDIKIEGSNDLVHWATLRDTTTQTASDINIRRTPCSCRYFRVSVDCTTMSDVAIMGFDFEYYMRFLHRLR